jgi:hypothetical protein
MSEPAGVHPSMVKADLWPLSAVETVLLVSLVYLALLIGLAGTRFGGRPAAAQAAPAPALAAAPRPVALRQQLVLASCVTARTVPQSYAGERGVQQPLAFGPPVEPAGPLTVAEINGELIHRLCGGVGTPGGPYHGPDRRLYVALDAAVNGRDPNRRISRAEWSAGVDRLITRDGLWPQARVVTRVVPAGTATFGMRVRPGADPLVLRTRLAARQTSRFLVLPVRSSNGRTVTLTLRLQCGFQPVW